MFTSLSAAVHFVQSNQLKPFYLLSDDAKRDFIAYNESKRTNYNNEVVSDEDSVVVGLAPDKFEYESMNKAFRWVVKVEKLHYRCWLKDDWLQFVLPGCCFVFQNFDERRHSIDCCSRRKILQKKWWISYWARMFYTWSWIFNWKESNNYWKTKSILFQ